MNLANYLGVPIDMLSGGTLGGGGGGGKPVWAGQRYTLNRKETNTLNTNNWSARREKAMG